MKGKGNGNVPRDRRDRRGRFVGARGAETELKRALGRPQVRARHKRALTRKEIGLFLSILGETCNVSLAARELKRSTRVFYDLKKRDPDFRAAWMEALREGYDHLEMELVRRARFGTPKDVYYQGKKTGTTRVFNDAAALRLLHFHRKSVGQQRSADSGRRDGAAIFDELAARLAEIRAEKDAKGREADDGEA
ncbi:MAG TPA: hypothetical protein VF535_07565 [Allosphingosinicella sp.]